MSIEGHAPQLNTPLRAEMSAVHRAVDVAAATDDEIVIFTDCLTLIWNLIGMLQTPQRFVGHKHGVMLTQIAAMLQSSGRKIYNLKVRAHIGIAGNEFADAVAKGTAPATDSTVFIAAGRAGRGCAWGRGSNYPGAAPPAVPVNPNAPLLDADNLNDAVLLQATATY